MPWRRLTAKVIKATVESVTRHKKTAVGFLQPPLVQIGLVGHRIVNHFAATAVKADTPCRADAAVFPAQFFQFFTVQAIKAQHGVLRILGDAQQLVDLDMQDVVVAVLRVLDQEHHQERDDGG
ncbi:hypothetical protein AO063_16090 [Pseudomonas fluorescens ICMP 11288]|uniref:Uncharacterized protein n=1 Tax=Pseudomonas fluorescens ICMP 11288 TaxID=1198309 RepID=A0A0W0I3C0_PSEFL|nr:hypothetical protein AO063_16090 [Pseudomonas fluorescens ICMP 11288]